MYLGNKVILILILIGGTVSECVIVYRCCHYHVRPLFVGPIAPHACAFVKTVSVRSRECKSSFLAPCQPTPSPSPCHLFRRAGAGAWRRAPLPILIEDASRLLWCPAGTAASGRRQREGTEEDTELIATTAVTNSRSGGTRRPIGITTSLTLAMLRRGGGVCLCLHGEREER